MPAQALPQPLRLSEARKAGGKVPAKRKSSAKH